MAQLKWNNRQYLTMPRAISCVRTKYKKYKLRPRSIIRKIAFSTRSQTKLSETKVGLVSKCAGIHMQYTDMLMTRTMTKSTHLMSRAFLLSTMIKPTRFAMICKSSCTCNVHKVTCVSSANSISRPHHISQAGSVPATK